MIGETKICSTYLRREGSKTVRTKRIRAWIFFERGVEICMEKNGGRVTHHFTEKQKETFFAVLSCIPKSTFMGQYHYCYLCLTLINSRENMSMQICKQTNIKKTSKIQVNSTYVFEKDNFYFSTWGSIILSPILFCSLVYFVHSTQCN